MKFIVSSTALYSHLQAIFPVINSKNALPILDYFLFDVKDGELSVVASDNENTITTSVELVENEGTGRFAIIAKTIMDAMKEFPEQPITFDIDMETLNITIDNQTGSYHLMAENADGFPVFTPLDKNAVSLDMEASILMKGISHTLFASADDELRPVMNGIYFDITTDDVTFVASDGHKLVKEQTTLAKGSERAAFVLPKKPATILKNLLQKEEGFISIEFNENNAVFMLKNFKLCCRLIDGRYPNYNSVIPQNNLYHITFDRRQVISALRRVAVFADPASNLVKLHIENDLIVVSSQDIGFSTSAKESAPCQFTGDSIDIGFKVNYLIDILNSMSTDEVVIELTDPSRAGIIVPSEQEEGNSLLMLLMPMMIND
ncbi:MAG: DNA polymerase III subunit beta [Bacteroidaceae bacterium]|nr:DNA polymerase III subunit beta [Bacteroidaceae bacterium]